MLNDSFRWDNPFPRTGCNLDCDSQYSKSIVQQPHLAAKMKSHDLWMAFLKDPAK
jgi:hypothetical protein